jgi:ParB family transcriptional regulator, chromosome partitioning protein
MARKGGLGKGLSALIPGDDLPVESGLLQIPIERIIPNPGQPRSHFDLAELESLAESIRIHGVLQPLVLTSSPGSDTYTLVAGERRWRASQMAGLMELPAIVRPVSEQERLELALVENIQRTDLEPLELAEAYRRLEEEFGLTHEDIAVQVGKSRPTVTNTLRLLDLVDEVKQALRERKISEGHARALLGLTHRQAQAGALETVIKLEFNVRRTEELVRLLNGERAPRKPRAEKSAEIAAIEDRLRGYLGTRVALHHGKKGGSVTIYYFSNEELEALLARIVREG